MRALLDDLGEAWRGLAVRMRVGQWALALLAVLPVAAASAEEVMVFAASSLHEALKDAVAPFEAATGHKVVFNFGGSNDLARQIKAGAPADLFFSADKAQMDGLEKEGLVGGADRIDVLSNALVVVVPRTSALRIVRPADLAGLPSLALADPQAVPAGVYARTWLEGQGMWDKIKDKVIPALNVRAALAAVENESAEAGIVYRTDAVTSKRVKVVLEVPPAQAPAILYPLALMAASHKDAARDLMRHLTSPVARVIYEKHGFVVLSGK